MDYGINMEPSGHTYAPRQTNKKHLPCKNRRSNINVGPSPTKTTYNEERTQTHTLKNKDQTRRPAHNSATIYREDFAKS